MRVTMLVGTNRQSDVDDSFNKLRRFQTSHGIVPAFELVPSRPITILQQWERTHRRTAAAVASAVVTVMLNHLP